MRFNLKKTCRYGHNNASQAKKKECTFQLNEIKKAIRTMHPFYHENKACTRDEKIKTCTADVCYTTEDSHDYDRFIEEKDANAKRGVYYVVTNLLRCFYPFDTNHYRPDFTTPSEDRKYRLTEEVGRLPRFCSDNCFFNIVHIHIRISVSFPLYEGLYVDALSATQQCSLSFRLKAALSISSPCGLTLYY